MNTKMKKFSAVAFKGEDRFMFSFDWPNWYRIEEEARRVLDEKGFPDWEFRSIDIRA